MIYVAKFKLRLDLINGIRKIESSQNKRDLFRINNGSNSLKFTVVRHSRIHHNPSSLRDKLLMHLVYLYKLANIADECTETHCNDKLSFPCQYYAFIMIRHRRSTKERNFE